MLLLRTIVFRPSVQIAFADMGDFGWIAIVIRLAIVSIQRS